MITKRIIPCLDVKDGRVVKGVNFLGLADVSSPVKLAEYYSRCGATRIREERELPYRARRFGHPPAFALLADEITGRFEDGQLRTCPISAKGSKGLC